MPETLAWRGVAVRPFKKQDRREKFTLESLGQTLVHGLTLKFKSQ
jgi:hypothetical protein